MLNLIAVSWDDASLKWWAKNASKYPNVSQVAKAYLAFQRHQPPANDYSQKPV